MVLCELCRTTECKSTGDCDGCSTSDDYDFEVPAKTLLKIHKLPNNACCKWSDQMKTDRQVHYVIDHQLSSLTDEAYKMIYQGWQQI